MADVLAPIICLAAVALFVGAWVFYLRRVRQGRADPVVDPSWPSNLRPAPRHLYDPADQDVTHSLYVGTDDPEMGDVRRRRQDSG